MNSEIDEEDCTDYDIQDTDSVQLLLQREAGWTQNIAVGNLGVVYGWGNVKAELTRAKLAVSSTVARGWT